MAVMESPPLEGFNRCVDVALGDTGRGGLMLGLHDLRGLFPPKQFYNPTLLQQRAAKPLRDCQIPLNLGRAPDLNFRQRFNTCV